MKPVSANEPLSVRSNIVWNAMGNFIYLFVQWILTYVVVRVLGFADAGVFSLAMTVAGVFAVVATYGMRSYQASDVEGQHSFKIYLCSRVITCIVALALCLVFTAVNGYSPYVFLCISAYMLFKVLEAISDVYQGLLQKEMRLDYVGKSYLVKGAAILVVFLAAVMVFRSLLVAICTMSVVMVLVIVLYERRRAALFEKKMAGTPDDSSLRKGVRLLLATCLPLALYGLFFTIMGQAPRYFIEMLLGEEALGYYASIAMPVVIIQVSGSFIFSPLVTPMAQSLSDGDRIGFLSMVKKVVLFIVVLAVISVVLGILFGDSVLVWAFGSEIAPYTYLLMPLVACAIFTCLGWFLASVLTVMRVLKTLLIVSGASMAIVLCGCVPFIQQWGMNGASFILVIALVFFSLVCMFVIGIDERRRRAQRRRDA
jgi:O-antigen/teichoic acid export membrane protein